MNGMPTATQMRILSLTGQVVLPWTRIPGLQGWTMDVSRFDQGLYILQAQGNTGDVVSSRFVLEN